MTFRIGIVDAQVGPRVTFEGRLDVAALRAIEAQVRGLRSRSGAAVVGVLLLEGTEIDPECVEGVRALQGATVEAASPFLARWLGGPPPAPGPRREAAGTTRAEGAGEEAMHDQPHPRRTRP